MNIDLGLSVTLINFEDATEDVILVVFSSGKFQGRDVIAIWDYRITFLKQVGRQGDLALPISTDLLRWLVQAMTDVLESARAFRLL